MSDHLCAYAFDDHAPNPQAYLLTGRSSPLLARSCAAHGMDPALLARGPFLEILIPYATGVASGP
jgi:hypothetical protein